MMSYKDDEMFEKENFEEKICRKLSEEFEKICAKVEEKVKEAEYQTNKSD